MQAATYDVRDRLGTGGYGEVYLATQTIPGGLSRKVAIKVLKSNIDDSADAVLRLLDEGKMLSQLRHPCIVGIHELTRIDGRLALITEYIEGTDLSKHCRRDNLLPERLVWHIGAEVASALDCVWNTLSDETNKPLKLIHRDIKPANIRIGRFGEIKLLDFGIARTTEMARHADTVAGTLPFTPGFVPPEVFLRGEVNHSTDVYALGCTIYRLLTGRRYYKKLDLPDTVALAVSQNNYNQHLEERLTHIKREGGRKLLRAVLAYDVDDRPTAAAVSLACEELLDRVPGISMRRWARENPPRDSNVGKSGPLTGCSMESRSISLITPPVAGLVGGAQPIDDDRTPLQAPARSATPPPVTRAPLSGATPTGVPTRTHSDTFTPLAEVAKPSLPISEPVTETKNRESASGATSEKSLAEARTQLMSPAMAKTVLAPASKMDAPVVRKRDKEILEPLPEPTPLTSQAAQAAGGGSVVSWVLGVCLVVLTVLVVGLGTFAFGLWWF
jgi:serine/threonine protein kinase